MGAAPAVAPAARRALNAKPGYNNQPTQYRGTTVPASTVVPRGPYQEPEPRSYGTIGNILFKKFVIMVQFIRPRTIFGLGRVKLRPSHRVESGFSARGCPHCTELCIAHYFIIQNLRLSKNFPPFGRRVAVSSLHQNHRTSLPVFCCRRVQAQTRANAA